MIETILIARDRKTGKDILLCGREVKITEQIAAYKELSSPNDEFENAVLADVNPRKKPLKFLTKAESEARAKAAAEAEAKAKAEAEANENAEQSQPESSGPKTNKKKGKK